MNWISCRTSKSFDLRLIPLDLLAQLVEYLRHYQSSRGVLTINFCAQVYPLVPFILFAKYDQIDLTITFLRAIGNRSAQPIP
jgi:hypothetical protein